MREARSLSPSTDSLRADFLSRFARLRSTLQMHPAEATAASTFEAAARTARAVAVECLPLGVAVVMHLYALCALRCVPLPWLSPANFRRRALLHAIDSNSLIVANTGSERAAGAHDPVTITLTRDGLRIDGTYAYMSLASVADVVLFSAPFRDSTVLCAADMRRESVRIGAPQFSGSMRLSDTCPVSFQNHCVARSRYLIVPTDSVYNCMAQYQRSWFHLLLTEAFLARIDVLHEHWDVAHSAEELASLQELACLREYSLRLLDTAAWPGAVESLARVTAAMKLRVSRLAQSTATALRGLDDADASELGYIRRQPPSDDIVLRRLAS
jgi:alkylation response protein AidB-like acyl-CoA dehydrogenase